MFDVDSKKLIPLRKASLELVFIAISFVLFRQGYCVQVPCCVLVHYRKIKRRKIFCAKNFILEKGLSLLKFVRDFLSKSIQRAFDAQTKT